MERETGVRGRRWLVVPALLLAACGGDQPGAMGTEGAHEHGVARLNVVVEGTTATVEFLSPAMGVYGFEYEPTSDEDRRRQAQGLETLRTRFAEMLVFDPGLGCTVEPIHVGMEGEPHDHGAGDHAHEEGEAHEEGAEHAHDPSHHHGEDYRGHEAEHAHEDEHSHEDEHAHEDPQAHDDEHAHDGHAEVHGEFRVTCQQPLSGTRLTLNVGQILPGIEQIDVQVIGDRPVGGRYRATGSTVQL